MTNDVKPNARILTYRGKGMGTRVRVGWTIVPLLCASTPWAVMMLVYPLAGLCIVPLSLAGAAWAALGLAFHRPSRMVTVSWLLGFFVNLSSGGYFLWMMHDVCP